MSKSRRTSITCTLLLIAASILCAPSITAQGGCTTYHTTAMVYAYGFYFCALTGVACTECVASQSDCYYDSGTELSGCNIYEEQRW